MKIASLKPAPQTAWLQHDWLSNPFAPQLRIVQALVKGGKTASGAGFSRYDAFSRCLGETAEILALSPQASSEGVAAGPDFEFAAAQALCERLERWALWNWWHGSLVAQPVSAAELVGELRNKATIQRRTRLWHLPDFAPLGIVIALSESSTNTQPIMGFGANLCPKLAAQSALIELGLMELTLKAPTTGMLAYFERVSPMIGARLPEGGTRKIAAAPSKELQRRNALELRLGGLGIGFTLNDLTTPQTGLTVVQAQIPDAPSWADQNEKDKGPLI